MYRPSYAAPRRRRWRGAHTRRGSSTYLRLSVHRLLDGRDDVGVGAAPADVAAHQFANLIGRARPALGYQANGGAELPRRAIPALERIVLDERLLERVQCISARKPLHGGDLRPILHDRERQARIDPAAVDQHGAGTALAVITAFFGS